MEKLEKSTIKENNDAPSCISSNIDNIKRCLICNKIPLIKLFQKDNEFFINYSCENMHKTELTLEKFLSNQKNNLTKIPCIECNKENNFYNFFYCVKCNKILCIECIKTHLINQDQTTLLSRYDSTCLQHNQFYVNYCIDCHKNLCMLCLNNHKNHKIILLLDFIPSKNYINELKSKIGNFNEIRKYKNEIIQSLKDEIDLLEKSYLEYEKNMQLQVSLINNLIFTYNFEEKLNNYNFEIIENLKIIETIKFPSPDFNNCKNVFEKAEYFLLFMGIKEKKKNKIQTNFNLLHSNIFSNLNKHTDKINQIIILKDGRIASSSNDSSILIYNKEMNNIDIMIKEHNKKIFNIYQSSNGNILECCTGGLISIYELTSLNSYKCIQSFKAHDAGVGNIIELKDGRFISCSDDKKIKIWKLTNNQLLFDNILIENKQNSFSNLLEYEENKLILSPIQEGSIIFLDIHKLKRLNEIKDIECYWSWNVMKKFNNDIIVVGGKKFIYLVSIQKQNLINKLEIESTCCSLFCLLDGTLLLGDYDGYLHQYIFKDNNLEEISKKEVHKSLILCINQLNNGIVLSGSYDKTINLYKIE